MFILLQKFVRKCWLKYLLLTEYSIDFEIFSWTGAIFVIKRKITLIKIPLKDGILSSSSERCLKTLSWLLFAGGGGEWAIPGRLFCSNRPVTAVAWALAFHFVIKVYIYYCASYTRHIDRSLHTLKAYQICLNIFKKNTETWCERDIKVKVHSHYTKNKKRRWLQKTCQSKWVKIQY